MKIVNVYKSETYKNDNRFTDKQSKNVYYGGNFWADDYYVVKERMFIPVAKVGNEILTTGIDEDKLKPEDKELIIKFFESSNPAEQNFIALDPKTDRDEVMNASLVVMMGRSKGWWILRK